MDQPLSDPGHCFEIRLFYVRLSRGAALPRLALALHPAGDAASLALPLRLDRHNPASGEAAKSSPPTVSSPILAVPTTTSSPPTPLPSTPPPTKTLDPSSSRNRRPAAAAPMRQAFEEISDDEWSHHTFKPSRVLKRPHRAAQPASQPPLEMSGVTSAPWRDTFVLDRADVRYLKLRDSAEHFAALQLGVCPFRWDPAKSAFVAHLGAVRFFPKSSSSCRVQLIVAYEVPEILTPVASALKPFLEGLLLQGACIASILGQGGSRKYHITCTWLRYFKNDRDRRDLVTCGAAAGIAAAFRAPVGGVLFALEIVSTWWRSALLWRAFFTTAMVAVVLRALIDFCKSGRCGLFGKGSLIMFDVTSDYITYHLVDLPPVITLGVLGGILGSLYNFFLDKVLRLYNLINEKGQTYKLLLTAIVTICTSCCLFGLPWIASCKPCPTDTEEACPSIGRSGNFKKFQCAMNEYNDLASLFFNTNDDTIRIQKPLQCWH